MRKLSASAANMKSQPSHTPRWFDLAIPDSYNAQSYRNASSQRLHTKNASRATENNFRLKKDAHLNVHIESVHQFTNTLALLANNESMVFEGNLDLREIKMYAITFLFHNLQ